MPAVTAQTNVKRMAISKVQLIPVGKTSPYLTEHTQSGYTKGIYMKDKTIKLLGEKNIFTIFVEERFLK